MTAPTLGRDRRRSKEARLRIEALALAGALLVACSPRLGTNDVELEYVSSTALSPGFLYAVRARLSAARLEAEVTGVGDDRIRVVLDGDRADLADRMLAKPGDLVVYRLDPAHPREPAPLIDLERTPAQLDGKRVLVAIHRAAADLLALESPDEIVAVAFLSRTIWKGRLRDCMNYEMPAIVIAAGDDVAGYKRARSLAALFDAPTLSPLSRTRRESLPTDWPLAIMCLALPLVVAIGWMFFVRRIDRARPEPWWLLLATLCLGAVGQQLAKIGELGSWSASPYLDFRSMSLDHSPAALPLSWALCTLVVGVSEEGAKLLAVWTLAFHRREFDEPVDGIVYAAAAAIRVRNTGERRILHTWPVRGRPRGPPLSRRGIGSSDDVRDLGLRARPPARLAQGAHPAVFRARGVTARCMGHGQRVCHSPCEARS